MIINKQGKIFSWIILSIFMLFIAILVYVYQSEFFKIRADQISTPSSMCITGKLKIGNKYVPSKCYDAIKNPTTIINEDIYMQKGEPYTITFTMGDFMYDQNRYMAPYMQCTDSSSGQGWIWESNNHPSPWDSSLIYFLDLGINSNIFDDSAYANVSTMIGNRKINGVNYTKPAAHEGIKRDIPFQEMKIDNNYYSGVRQDKDRGYDFRKEFGPDDKHCTALGYSVGEKAYYGGANQPGAFASISFTPLSVKEDGRILGKLSDNNNNYNLRGLNMLLYYQIVDNIDEGTTGQRTIPAQVASSDNVSDIDKINDDQDAIDYQRSDAQDEAMSSDLSTHNIKSLVSTGSSLWFNVFLAILLSIGLGYLIFRKDIFNASK